jgi:hypothetical protein
MIDMGASTNRPLRCHDFASPPHRVAATKGEALSALDGCRRDHMKTHELLAALATQVAKLRQAIEDIGGTRMPPMPTQ